MADAPETPAARPDFGLQYFPNPRAERQVSVADDRLGDAAGSIAARRAHCGDAIDEFDLPDRRHFRWTVLAVHRTAFKENRRGDVVPADIRKQLGQLIATPLWRVPKMVMRVDNRQIRLERRLGRPSGQPRLQLGIIAIRNPA